MARQWPQDGIIPSWILLLTIRKRKERYTEKETGNGKGVKNTFRWFALRETVPLGP